MNITTEILDALENVGTSRRSLTACEGIEREANAAETRALQKATEARQQSALARDRLVQDQQTLADLLARTAGYGS